MEAEARTGRAALLALRRRGLRGLRRLAWGRPQMGWRLTPVSRFYGFDRGTPVDRFYIDGFLRAHAHDIRGVVLDVADDTHARRFGGDRITRTDVLHPQSGQPGTTVRGDLETGEGLPVDTYDCFLLIETLQFVFDLPRAIEVAHDLLKPGGVVLATSSGVRPIDTDWKDYWRLTSASMERLFAGRFGIGNVRVHAFGNVLSATAFLYGLAQEELTRRDLERRDPAFEVTIAVRARRPPG